MRRTNIVRMALYAIALGLFMNMNLLAQKTFENVDPTVSQFEIVRGSGDPDYTGALNLKIPLMKVPGRGGLDYDLELVYVHGNGVPASESASWVGLGWNLNLYQISCSPAFCSDGSSTVSSTGKDMYYLSYPGGSTAIYQFADGWRPLDWSAIKIDVVPESNYTTPFGNVIYSAFKKFTITDVDGKRYVFADRLAQESTRMMRNHCYNPPNPPCFSDSHGSRHPYFYVFKLSRILGADYVDGSSPADDIPGNGGTDLGSWIKLVYSAPRTVSSSFTNPIHMEMNDLTQIVTPTHTANFNVSITSGNNYFIYNGFQKGDQLAVLNDITLNPGGIKVEFFTSRKFGWVGTPEDGYQLINQDFGAPVQGGGHFFRLGLDEVRIISSSGSESIPSYKFEYGPHLKDGVPQSDASGNPLEAHGTSMGVDGWGYYNVQYQITHPTEAQVKWLVWLLKKVTYPTGGTVEYEYETNRYQTYYSDFRGSVGDTEVLSGGVRLKKQTLTDPLTQQASVYQYQYALTNKRHPGGYGFLSAEPLAFGDLGATQNSVGKNLRTEVHYPDVEITRPDNSKVRKYYTSAFSGVNGFAPSGQTYDPYTNYQYCYNTVTLQPDAVLENTTINPGSNLYDHFNWPFTGCPDDERFKYFLESVCYKDRVPPPANPPQTAFREEGWKEYDDNVANLFNGAGQKVQVPIFNNGWKRGHLTYEEFYHAPIGNPTLDATPMHVMTYYYNLAPIKSEPYTVTYNCTPSCSNDIDAFVTSGWAQLTKVETKTRIAPNSTTLALVKKEDYQYNLTNGLVKRQVDTNSDGTKRLTSIKYPIDYTTAPANDDFVWAIDSLKTRHIHNAVIQKVIRQKNTTQTDSSVYAAELVKYKKTPTNQILPFETYKFDTTAFLNLTDNQLFSITSGLFTKHGQYKRQVTYEQYDAHGNLTLSKDYYNTPSSTIWAYNSALPIAQIRNATPSQATVSVFDDNSASGWSGSNGIWSIVSGVYKQTDGSTTAPWDNPKYYDNVNIDDAILEADIRFDDASGDRYIALSKFISTSAFVRFEFRKTASSPGVRIFAVNGTPDVSLITSKTFAYNTWYHVRGEIQGSTAKLYVDGELLVTWTSSAVNIANGKIGLCTSATRASFDNVRFYPPNALATSTSFDPGFFKINTKTDESGISAFYTYDGLGRLNKVFDRPEKLSPDNLLKEATYFYSSPFSSSNPNYIQEITYRTSSAFTTSRTYADGLGRSVQTQQNEGTGAIRTATTYDLLSRVKKVTKPFFDSGNQAYKTGAEAAANSYYAGNHPAYYSGSSSQEFDIGQYAYSENAYYADPLNRVDMQIPPGTAYRNPDTSPLKFVKLEYLSNTGTEFTGYSANTLHKQRRTDENGTASGNIVDTFTDVFGNTVATIVDPTGASPLKTTFMYDVLGNLKQVNHPKPSLITTYSYNTLSQLTQKNAPDDNGLSDYLYDKNGNLRFVKDAKGAAASTPYFIYYKYDVFNRKIEEGTMPVNGSPGNFTQANANNRSFPTNQGETFKVKYHYDFAGYAPGAPQKNLPGRMDAVEYVSERFSQPSPAPPTKGYIFYSYDERGRVDWIENWIPKATFNDGSGALATRIEYDYDRQGNVTKIYFRRIFPPAAASDAFYIWYEYDELGRLKKVFTNTVDTQPGAADGEYIYWPSGQVRRLVLGGTVQGVDYLYNSREWLTQINHQNLISTQDPGGDGGGSGVPTADRFGQIIGYNKQDHIAWNHSDFVPQFNGNISWTIHQTQHNTTPLGLSGWVFKYDKANRLIKGNWGFYTSQWSAPTDLKYDVVGPEAHPNNLITYDANGNIDYMIRYNENGAATNMDYVYIANTNKLSNITYSGQTSGTYSYTYDNNGNVIGDAKKLGTGSITYDDYRNLPKRVVKNNTPTGAIDYDYDGNGQRISKNDIFYVPGADGKVMAVYKIDGTHLYWNIWGLDLIGQRFYDPDNIP